MKFVETLLCTLILLVSVVTNAQETIASSATAVVPRLVNFSGTAVNDQGKPVTGIIGLTFSIYNRQEGGAPLWMETQNVQPDAKGNYTVQLGATASEGLPLDEFTSGDARWLGVRLNGGEERPRVLLLSVPYALKAADAQTLAGLPASAFVLAAPAGSNAPIPAEPASSSNPSSSANIGGSGTQDFIPLWTDNNGDLGNSILYQLGSGSSAKIGINEKSPLFTLDVNGQELVRGLFEMATQNYASKTKGYDSQPLNLESSAFNSTTGTYTLNHFQWQAEPTGNNTTTPGATLNLLYGTDPNQPAETGLNIASTGEIAFAKGQTFPGTGTITGITTATGSGLSGGGTSGNLTLSLVNTCATNQVLQWNGSTWACSSAGTGTITGVKAGTDLTGGGTSGNVTLNLDTTRVPLLAASNTFTRSNTFSAANTPIYAVSSGSNSGTIEGIQNATCCASIGIYGQSADSSGFGVEGYDTASTGSPIGVYGLTFAPGGYGVYGSNAASTGEPTGVYGTTPNCSGCGYGVYGSGGIAGVVGTSNSGYAMIAQGNVEQCNECGGWVKGMVYVNGHTSPYSIVRCFNSTLSGSAATTPPCGFTLKDVNGSGEWIVDFGFGVTNRFWSATLGSPNTGINGIPSIAADNPWPGVSLTSTQLFVVVYSGQPTLWNFGLVVY
jgi:hypothetical protein